MLEWNQRINLTAIKEADAVDRLHFLDSLACLLEPIPSGAAVLDVGAGAGFPGLPLKIVRPDLQLTLLEATGKKARFLERVSPPDVRVVNDRAETAAASLRETFDVVVTRALAALPTLLELTLPFCRLTGSVLALKKGAALEAEIASAARALAVLGGELAPAHTYELDGEVRHVLVIRKVRMTPSGYPRRSGMPAKNPL